MLRQITVLAARTQEALECQGADVEDLYCATLAEAKQRARYYLSQAYTVASEASEPLGYAQVLVDGVCTYDYYARGTK